MANEKKVFSATDAAPAVLYAKTDPASELAYPVVMDANGNLIITSGLAVPKHDYISLTPPALPTTIIFKTGGSGGTTVATLTLTYSGTDVATVTRT